MTGFDSKRAAAADKLQEPWNEDDDSGGGDFFIDMVKTVLAVGFFLLFVCTIGAVLSGLIA